jgi:PAS domain S-box-containing protein
MVLDLQGQIVRFNRACEQTTGYSFDEVRNRCFWNLFSVSAEKSSFPAIFEQIKLGQGTKEYEQYWVTKDGNLRLIAWSNTALFDGEGKIEYIISTGIDITKRKLAEDSLQRQLAAVEAASDGIGILDDNGDYTYVNQAHIEMFGYSDITEFVGKKWHDLYREQEIKWFETNVFPTPGGP